MKKFFILCMFASSLGHASSRPPLSGPLSPEEIKILSEEANFCANLGKLPTIEEISKNPSFSTHSELIQRHFALFLEMIRARKAAPIMQKKEVQQWTAESPVNVERGYTTRERALCLKKKELAKGLAAIENYSDFLLKLTDGSSFSQTIRFEEAYEKRKKDADFNEFCNIAWKLAAFAKKTLNQCRTGLSTPSSFRSQDEDLCEDILAHRNNLAFLDEVKNVLAALYKDNPETLAILKEAMITSIKDPEKLQSNLLLYCKLKASQSGLTASSEGAASSKQPPLSHFITPEERLTLSEVSHFYAQLNPSGPLPTLKEIEKNPSFTYCLELIKKHFSVFLANIERARERQVKIESGLLIQTAEEKGARRKAREEQQLSELQRFENSLMTLENHYSRLLLLDSAALASRFMSFAEAREQHRDKIRKRELSEWGRMIAWDLGTFVKSKIDEFNSTDPDAQDNSTCQSLHSLGSEISKYYNDSAFLEELKQVLTAFCSHDPNPRNQKLFKQAIITFVRNPERLDKEIFLEDLRELFGPFRSQNPENLEEFFQNSIKNKGSMLMIENKQK